METEIPEHERRTDGQEHGQQQHSCQRPLGLFDPPNRVEVRLNSEQQHERGDREPKYPGCGEGLGPTSKLSQFFLYEQRTTGDKVLEDEVFSLGGKGRMRR